jgi:hypothetical protein
MNIRTKGLKLQNKDYKLFRGYVTLEKTYYIIIIDNTKREYIEDLDRPYILIPVPSIKEIIMEDNIYNCVVLKFSTQDENKAYEKLKPYLA